MTSSWLSNWKRSAPAARPVPGTSPLATNRVRPILELLEGRCLLTTLTVTSPADSGLGSLRQVIAAAQSGDTIVFSPTLFSSTQTSTSTKKGKPKSPPPPPPAPNTITLATGQLAITKNLTIRGLGVDQLYISGNYASRVFEVARGATVTLSGMTVTKGFASATTGGGILNNGTLTLTNVVIAGNGATYGGGVYNGGGTLHVGSSTLGGNYADGIAGGGIYNAGGIVSIGNSTLSNNRSRYGGGIYNGGGRLTLTNSALSGNAASADYNGRGGYGGGIYNSAGSVTISNSIVSGNRAGAFGLGGGGGGIYNALAGTVTVRDSSSITGNTGSFDGAAEDVNNLGALYCDGASTIGVAVGNAAVQV